MIRFQSHQINCVRRSVRFSAMLVASLVSTVAVLFGSGSSGAKSLSTSHMATGRGTMKPPKHRPTKRKPGGLSGRWSGQYTGAFSGTFTLNWTQSGSRLSGTIVLSNPSETTSVTGSLSGKAIKFGTVSGAVYNGTISATKMSGSYETPRGGGSWSASRS